jgi:hypothetical protein
MDLHKPLGIQSFLELFIYSIDFDITVFMDDPVIVHYISQQQPQQVVPFQESGPCPPSYNIMNDLRNSIVQILKLICSPRDSILVGS